MSTPETKTELLKVHEAELVKQYTAYDVSLRPEYVYTATADATNGAACLVTRYVYDGTSSRVIKRKEAYSSWNSTWDI